MLRTNQWARYLLVAFLAFSILATSGCSGCRDKRTVAEKKKAEEEKKKLEEKKKKKPDFKSTAPVILPSALPVREVDKTVEKTPEELAEERMLQSFNKTKQGHWVSAQYQIIANNFNAKGTLTSECFNRAGNAPTGIEGTDYYVTTQRPVSLPKEEWRNLETMIFLPVREGYKNTTNVRFTLRSSTGLVFEGMQQPFSLMRPHQYHWVVLSNQSPKYAFIKLMDVVTIPSLTLEGEQYPPFYQLVLSKKDDPPPIPRQSLAWTTIAYLLWDDYSPEQLDKEQQNALLDWLHHGGQLMISGPDGLDKLENSFLSDYLPASFDSTFNLTNEDFDELNANWSVPSIAQDDRGFRLPADAPLIGVRFKPKDDAEYVQGTGKLAIERRVGRGRICVTSFSLNNQALRRWKSFSSFMNGCIMRRPSRTFGKMASGGEFSFAWTNDGASPVDPLVGSMLRYTSRDLANYGTQANHWDTSDVSTNANGNLYGYGQAPLVEDFRIKDPPHSKSKRNLTEDVWRYGGYNDDTHSGTAGWNDDSAISSAARATLKEAAGITPPSAEFVLKMLGIYLLALVPLNWLFFRLLGRVEWAWIAAPLIALIGSVCVVKFASLDVGFARKNTQVGLLEVYADYPRAHLSEYSALYTSLSTNYDVHLDNITAQSLPFAASLEERFSERESLSQVTMNRTIENTLENFQVQSNSTGLLHTEYMLELGGALTYEMNGDGGLTVFNGTNIPIQSSGVIRRGENGFETVWIGDLGAGESSSALQFKRTDPDRKSEIWLADPEFTSPARRAKNIWLKNVKDLGALADAEQVLSFPELEPSLVTRLKILFKNRLEEESLDAGSMPMELNELSLNANEFIADYQRYAGSKNINVSRLFDTVMTNLLLEPGELRLIGVTGERLGTTRFNPQSTQIDRKSLVLVHLKKGQLPLASPDTNQIADFVKAKANDEDGDED